MMRLNDYLPSASTRRVGSYLPRAGGARGRSGSDVPSTAQDCRDYALRIRGNDAAGRVEPLNGQAPVEEERGGIRVSLLAAAPRVQ
jgi:hypothetical protein